jgi:hypothetical protein
MGIAVTYVRGVHAQGGQGVLPSSFEPSCSAGNYLAEPEQIFFEILEDAADREPYSGTTDTCVGRTWEIDIDATAIRGTCQNRSADGETDTVRTRHLTLQEPPGSSPSSVIGRWSP